jgi:hypothetical protein
VTALSGARNGTYNANLSQSRIPADSAPVAEITAFMKNLGVKEAEDRVMFLLNCCHCVFHWVGRFLFEFC